MARTIPYQPSLLRLLHALVAALIPLAWLTGLAVLLGHDGSWLPFSWSLPSDWVDIHGSVGAVLWPLALLFSLYAVSLGRARLRQPANAAALLVLAVAVASGKLMDESWVRDRQIHHLVYNVHVVAWGLLAAVLIWHVAAVLRRGGVPLAASMAQLRWRRGDEPWSWPTQLLGIVRIRR